MRRLMTAIALGWFVVPSVSYAQDPWKAVTSIATDTRVRVEATGARRISGRLLRADDTEIVIVDSFGDVARFRRQDVSIVEQLVGNADAKKRGARKGFLWGAVLSVLGTYGTLANGGAKELSIVYGTFMGGGALIGFLLADNPSYVVVYRARLQQLPGERPPSTQAAELADLTD